MVCGNNDAGIAIEEGALHFVAYLLTCSRLTSLPRREYEIHEDPTIGKNHEGSTKRQLLAQILTGVKPRISPEITVGASSVFWEHTRHVLTTEK